MIASVMTLISLIMLLQLLHKLHNLFLFILFGIQIASFLFIENTQAKFWSLIIALSWMGQVSFFAFGNSNSLSTIDISGAYTGLDDYNEIIVGLFTALIGFSGPILFFICTILLAGKLAINQSPRFPLELYKNNCLGFCLVVCTLRSLELLVFSIVISLLRHHLFIWSVFSPKYIYEVLFSALDALKCIMALLSIFYFNLIGKH